MFGLNKFQGIGHIGTSRVFADKQGQPLTALSIAFDDSYVKPETKEKVERTIWGEAIVKGDRTSTLLVGRLLYVEGKAVAEAYLDKEGKAVGVLKIKDARVKPLDRKPEAVEVEEEMFDEYDQPV